MSYRVLVMAALLLPFTASCGGSLVPMTEENLAMLEEKPPEPAPTPAPAPAPVTSPAPHSKGRIGDVRDKEDLIGGGTSPGNPKEEALTVPPTTPPPASYTPPPQTPDTPEEATCKNWLVSWLESADPALVKKGSKVDVLWHEPAKKASSVFPGSLPPLSGSDVSWLGMDTGLVGDDLACRAHLHVIAPCASCSYGPTHEVTLYARYDLVPEGDAAIATRVTVILETEMDDATQASFERPLGDCGVLPGTTASPQTLCGVVTFDDYPKNGLMMIHDVSEVLVFDAGGHLMGHQLLGVVEDTEYGSSIPLGFIDPVPHVELNLGQDVLSVREEKVKPLGGHPGGYDDCAAFMIEATLTYYVWDGKGLSSIFSEVVDVFPDAPCASEYETQKYKDLVVDVVPECNGGGPCDLHLYYDQITPTDKLWEEIWVFSGKKYVKSKSL